MAKYELIKTIEARKLNPRSGLPLTEPAVSVPYSAILDKVEESWDFVKFTHLGLSYQCATSMFKEAARPYGAADETPAASAAAAAAESAEAPAAAPAKEVMIRWEELGGNPPVLRTKVPGGWLVSIRGGGATFFPDPNHSWDGKSLA